MEQLLTVAVVMNLKTLVVKWEEEWGEVAEVQSLDHKTTTNESCFFLAMSEHHPGATIHSRRWEIILFILLPKLASLAFLLNLTAHVDGDKASVGTLDSYVLLQGHCWRVISSGYKAEA